MYYFRLLMSNKHDKHKLYIPVIFKKCITELINLVRLQDCKLNTMINQNVKDLKKTKENDFNLQLTELQSKISVLNANNDLLKKRLAGKEESLIKLNDLLKQSYDTNDELNAKHCNEIANLQTKVNNILNC